MQLTLESEMAVLLNDLVASQDAMLELLGRKRKMLANVDAEGLAATADDEQRLLGNLQDCLQRREQLLARASTEGKPAASIRTLAGSLPPEQRGPLSRQLTVAGSRTRLLQHQSLINWVIIQRTLIHLSQMLEIIATGGRIQPTYGDGTRLRAGGTLVNQEV